jgi:hypothetical protein
LKEQSRIHAIKKIRLTTELASYFDFSLRLQDILYFVSTKHFQHIGHALTRAGTFPRDGLGFEHKQHLFPEQSVQEVILSGLKHFFCRESFRQSLSAMPCFLGTRHLGLLIATLKR